MGKKVRVLIVDDSLVFREVLARGICSDPLIEVIATATDPYEARDKILKYQPDVMTCDVEMPRMNGIEFLRRLLPQYPLPVVVVSTVSESVLDALNVGAVDFVSKPDISSAAKVENFIKELILKIKIASVAKVSKSGLEINTTANSIKAGVNNNLDRIIAIGASTGGTEAIVSIIKSLPPNTPGIAIVQHIPPIFSRMFADRLNTQTQLNVREAKNGDYLDKSTVLVAPGDQHMRLKKIGNRYKIECFTSDKVNGHCPSVDVLFESVAREVGANAIGIILTGMGYDGAKGLLAMKRKGARTIGQNQESSVVYGMPKAAYEIGAVEKQVPLEHIPTLICSMLK